MIINSRPLSYISMDDLEEPLTPSHMMIGRRLLSLPDVSHSENSDICQSTPSEISKRMKHLNVTLDHFWMRWKKEYLLELREGHRYHSTGVHGEQINVGDVVVVYDSDKHRGFWKLGVVEQLIVGRDDESRGAVVRVHQKGHKSTLLKRPVQRLYPIEMNCQGVPSTVDSTGNQADTDTVIESDTQADTMAGAEMNEEVEPEVIEDPIPVRKREPDGPPTRRSRRAAAQEARDRIVAWSYC